MGLRLIIKKTAGWFALQNLLAVLDRLSAFALSQGHQRTGCEASAAKYLYCFMKRVIMRFLLSMINSR